MISRNCVFVHEQLLTYAYIHTPGYQLCEFYNCSFVNDPATQSCHGYIPCTKDYQEDTHQNHFCHTIFHKRTNGLYELYSKGCHFSLLSRCDGRNECILDTSPEGRELTYCCCDGELCNVNVTYTHPENVDGGASGGNTVLQHYTLLGLQYVSIPTMEWHNYSARYILNVSRKMSLALLYNMYALSYRKVVHYTKLLCLCICM